MSPPAGLCSSLHLLTPVRRLIGRKFKDDQLQSDIKHLPYKVINKDGKPIVQVEVNGENKKFTPEEISAMVLGKMKEVAESYLGKKVTHAVVTVPAYFNVSLACRLPGRHWLMCSIGQPKAGHQGRRHHCRPERPPNCQRAHRRRHRLRSGQDGQRAPDHCLRPRWWYL